MVDMFSEFLIQTLKWAGIFAIPAVYLILINTKDNDINKLLKNCGLVNKDGKLPKLLSKAERAYGYDLVFGLKSCPGICLENFEKQQQAIEQYLGGEIQFKYNSGVVIAKVMNGKLEKKYDFTPIKLKGLTLIIGQGRNGLVTLKLDDENPHLLIAGMTGSGKSMLLRTMIVNLILTVNSDVKMHLADLKAGAEFGIYERSSVVSTFTRDISDTLELLKTLDNEMMKRYSLFREAGVVNLDEYNKNHPALPRHVLFIDEFANIVEEDKECLGYLKRLLRMARACGIHIVLCTQRPDAQTVPGAIKNNVGARIALYCSDPVNSKIIIDNNKAAYLTGNGHGILHTKDDMEFRGFYLETEKAKELIRHTIRRIEQVEENTSGVMSLADYSKGC